MILAVDVHYDSSRAFVAGVAFDHWPDPEPRCAYTSSVEHVSGYVPGRFYERELPCILQLLEEHQLRPDCIVIDGYVYLDGFSKPGLGKHLYEALHRKTRVIGVAKNPFDAIPDECRLFRGNSERPLYITCAGEPLNRCKEWIASMHGTPRYPDLLKQVDLLSRMQAKRPA